MSVRELNQSSHFLRKLSNITWLLHRRLFLKTQMPCLLTNTMTFFKYESLMSVFFCFNLAGSATCWNNLKTVDKGVSFIQTRKIKQKRVTCYFKHILDHLLARKKYLEKAVIERIRSLISLMRHLRQNKWSASWIIPADQNEHLNLIWANAFTNF